MNSAFSERRLPHVARPDLIIAPAAASGLAGKDLISIKDLSRPQILAILEESERMLQARGSRRLSGILDEVIVVLLFLEPSTRTRMSFESAALRLGGNYTSAVDPHTTSIAKGESLADTIRVTSSFGHMMVLRHPEKGAAKEAARYSDIPVINGGDGTGEHPTQALLDLFTINKIKGKHEGLHVAVVGDLTNGRTVHSLSYILAMFNNQITFVAPEELQVSRKLMSELREAYGAEPEMAVSLDAARDADVVYMTRVQRERFSSSSEYRRFAHYYRLDRKFLKRAREDITVMHPGPRLTEISPKVDKTPNSAYFLQAAYGIPVRMAILKSIARG